MSRFDNFLAPEWWLQVSDEHLQSAELLISDCKNATYVNIEGERCAYSRSIGLLLAISIENLLKANLILFKPELVTTQRVDNSITSGHPLLKQFHNVANFIIIEDKDRHTPLLKSLENFLTTSSRYPVGKYSSVPYTIPDVNSEFLDKYWRLHFELKRKFIFKLENDGWVSGLENKNIDTAPNDFRYFVNINGRAIYFSSLDIKHAKIVYSKFQL